MDKQVSPKSKSSIIQHPLALSLVLLAGAFFCLRVDPSVLPFNLSIMGAMALFAGARLGWRSAILICLGLRAVTDVVLWYQYHQMYPLFDPFVYGCLLLYIGLGFGLLRRTEHPGTILATTLAGSGAFFLITNFGSWLAHAMNYPMTFSGLMQSYAAAVPFYRNTLMGDLIFTGVLFGAHAVLSRAYFPAERVVPETGAS